jgi:hypothetical protein
VRGDVYEQPGDGRVGYPQISMATLMFVGEDSPSDQLGQVGTGRRGRDAGVFGQLTGRPRTTV